MRDVAIVGVGSTQFGRAQWSLLKMMCEASHEAIQDASLGDRKIDAVFVANMGSARNNRMAGLASALVDRMNLYPAAAETIENGPASGASAFKMGFLGVASGFYDVVLVCGGERMREVNNLEATEFVSFLSHRYAEYVYGVTLPGLAALFARMYMERYGVTNEHLAMVAIKNHANGLLNRKAHIRDSITMEGILTGPDAINNNPWVSEPLRFYDCCPVSDGSSALILAPANLAKELCRKPVRVAGIGQGTDTHAVHERPDPTELTAVRIASQKAFHMAGLTPQDIGVAELHDAFTILEIAESEEAGFFPKGEGHKALERGETQINGRLPINPSGGLKARGHPVGNTGVSQLVELSLQLRGDAGKYQVPSRPKHGFTVNFGGFGNNVIATVLSEGV
ncbi:MAG: acetyl-CoA acetyltransferase [Candidatus Riflebacteria bacterium]|nr:acetyl-CoA acetyltransferase [Candidatus Riflebacteria bacterium]